MENLSPRLIEATNGELYPNKVGYCKSKNLSRSDNVTVRTESLSLSPTEPFEDRPQRGWQSGGLRKKPLLAIPAETPALTSAFKTVDNFNSEIEPDFLDARKRGV